MDNWLKLVEDYENLIGKHFIDENGITHLFFGLVWSDDDYYFGLTTNDNKIKLVSCVGSLESWGFREINLLKYTT